MKFHLTETCTCFWKGLGTRASSGWFGTQRWQVVLPLPHFPSTGKTAAGICGKRGSRHHNFHSMACEQAGETTLGLLVSFPMAKKNSVLQWHTQPQFVVTGVARVDVLLHPQQYCVTGTALDSSQIHTSSRFYLFFQKAWVREWVSERRNSKSSPSAKNQN